MCSYLWRVARVLVSHSDCRRFPDLTQSSSEIFPPAVVWSNFHGRHGQAVTGGVQRGWVQVGSSASRLKATMCSDPEWQARVSMQEKSRKSQRQDSRKPDQGCTQTCIPFQQWFTMSHLQDRGWRHRWQPGTAIRGGNSWKLCGWGVA